MDKLTLKEHLLIQEASEERKRREDLSYTEKYVKKQLDRVIVELRGNESGVFTRLASRYDRLDKAIKLMGQKKNELNAQIKEMSEELFAAEDIVLTRVVETVSFTMTISKKSKQADKVEVDYKSIAEELAKLIPDDLQSKVDEIVESYTKITAQPDKSPSLSIKAKVEEGVVDALGKLTSKVTAIIKKVVKSVATWATKFDRKLDNLKKLAQVA